MMKLVNIFSYLAILASGIFLASLGKFINYESPFEHFCSLVGLFFIILGLLGLIRIMIFLPEKN